MENAFCLVFWQVGFFITSTLIFLYVISKIEGDNLINKKVLIFPVVYLFLAIGFFTNKTRCENKYIVQKVDNALQIKYGNNLVNLNRWFGQNFPENIKYITISSNSPYFTSWILPDCFYGYNTKVEGFE